jgi:hypothetical protein
MLHSGATKHICNDVNAMARIRPAPGWFVARTAGQRVAVNGIGDAIFSLPNGQMLLQGVLLVPSTSTSLLSISALDAAGFSELFQGGCCALHDGTELVLVAPRCAGSYTVHAHRGTIAAAVPAHAPVATWHRRLGHAGPKCLA